MPDLDPLTGKDPSSLSSAQLAERVAMERALREQEHIALRDALEAIRETFRAQVISDRRALELQAREYERRLDTLNHAHEQAVEAQAMTVPRELFDQYVKETGARETAMVGSQNEKFAAAIDAVNARVDDLVTWRSGIEGRLIGITVVVGIVVIVINLGIRFLPT